MIRFVFISFLFVFQIFIPGFTSGQNVLLTGTIPGGEGAEIRIMIYEDHVSFRKEILHRGVVIDSSHFQFELDLRQITLVYLEMEHYTYAMYLEPEGKYELICDTVNLKDNYRPFYNKELLPAVINSEPPPGLNSLLSSFNKQYNDFIVAEFGGIYQVRSQKVIDEFRKKSLTEYGEHNHPFIEEYILYKIASLELATSSSGKPALFREYFADQSILYNNPEFMKFFNDFFDKHVSANRFIKRIDLTTTINYNYDYPGLIDSLGKDSLLEMKS